MNRVYRKREYNVYQFEDEYVIHNTKGEFKTHHTHIKNFKTAKFLIDLSIHKSVPYRHLSLYLLESLLRITDDKEYGEKIQRLIDIESKKEKKHYHTKYNR